MKGYISNIEKETLENDNFRKVIYTAQKSQLVLMSLKPNEDIGEEIHEVDQFLRIEKGKGKAILNDIVYEVEDDFAIVVPAGAKHNVVNSDEGEMKLYTIYSTPEHRDGTVHKTKEEAMVDADDKFDGKITE
ncbi:MAG: cupin domain-containing protein [Candidatus Staskawiczbacteria bacterium]|nr:cupin domain-containing protein [Candidatus Staskawiczbacteria bacterium]